MMDCRPKPLPGTIRRRKRKRPSRQGQQQGSAFQVLLAVMGLLFGLAWTIGLLWFSLSMTNIRDKNTNNSLQENGVTAEDQPPPLIVNLWPSDASAENLQALLMDCPECDPNKPDSNNQQQQQPERVLIVRPPGQFGDIMTEFVEKYLEGSDMEITSSTVALNNPFPDDFDVLIHIATLPLLLEAFDVLLTAAEPTKALLTADDVLAVVQHLIKWHCRVAARASAAKSVVLTLDPTISYPLASEKLLENLYNQTVVPIARDEFAKKTMEHIDAGTAFWKTLLSKGKTLRAKENSNLPERASKLIQQTLMDGKCPEATEKTSWFYLSSPLETLLDSLWDSSSSVSGQVMDEN